MGQVLKGNCLFDELMRRPLFVAPEKFWKSLKDEKQSGKNWMLKFLSLRSREAA